MTFFRQYILALALAVALGLGILAANAANCYVKTYHSTWPRYFYNVFIHERV